MFDSIDAIEEERLMLDELTGRLSGSLSSSFLSYLSGKRIAKCVYPSTNNGFYRTNNHSCTGGARITTEGGSLKRDLRAGSVCLSVCLYVCSSPSVL